MATTLEKGKVRGGRALSYLQFGDELKTNSMQLGKRARKLGWELVQKPAVYEIVCSGSGRRYIGSSLRPDLRRAVHLYYLKNYWKFDSSNVFFANLELAEDVKKYGVDSFYMDILISAPDADSAELVKLEREYLSKLTRKKSYNRVMTEEDAAKLEHYDIFCNLDKDFNELFDEFKRCHVIFQFEEQHRSKSIKYLANEREKLFKARNAKKLTPTQLAVKLKELNMVRVARRKYFKDCKESYYAARNTLRFKLKELEKLYANSETPLY